MANVKLDGKLYVTTQQPRIVKRRVPQLSNAIRTVGTQRRLDNRKLNRFPFQGFPLGIGYSRMYRHPDNVLAGRGVGGMRFSTCETRFTPITLQHLPVSQTHNAPADHLRVYIPNFKGKAYGFFERDYATGNVTSLSVGSFGGSNATWTTSVIAVASGNTEGARIWHATVHKGRMFVILSASDPDNNGALESTETRYFIRRTVNGSTFEDAVNNISSPWGDDYVATTVTRRNNFNDDRALLLDFGEILLAAIYEDPSSPDGSTSQIRIYQSQNADTGSPPTWSGVVSIPSGDGPKAFLRYEDHDGVVMPILVTQEDIYAINISAGSFEGLLPFPVLTGDPNDGRGTTVGADGCLYVPTGSGDILQIARQGGSFAVSNIGPHSHADGLPTAFQGHCNFLLAGGFPWLLAAYGGHEADTQATILAFDYASGPLHGRPPVWHCIHYESTANADITNLMFSAADDATPRLHFAVEGAEASSMYHLKNPMVPVTTGADQDFKASGYIEVAEDDLGDPQTVAGVFKALVDADDLSADTTGEYITLKYGADGAAWDAVTLGNFVSGDKELDFGPNGVGISARTLRVRLEMARDDGDTTDTPKLKEFETQSRNKLLTLLHFSFPVDLEETAKVSGRTVAQVIADIEALEDKATLFTFQMGERAALNVEIPEDAPPQWDTRLVDGENGGLGRETGTVSIVVEEVT